MICGDIWSTGKTENTNHIMLIEGFKTQLSNIGSLCDSWLVGQVTHWNSVEVQEKFARVPLRCGPGRIAYSMSADQQLRGIPIREGDLWHLSTEDTQRFSTWGVINVFFLGVEKFAHGICKLHLLHHHHDHHCNPIILLNMISDSVVKIPQICSF